MKKNLIYKMLAVGASLLMMTTAMVTLQGCGSDDDAPVVASTDGGGGGGTGGTGGGGVAAVTNVFMDGIVGDLDYFFMHGSTSTDRSKFLVTFNDSATAGTSHLYMLDADSVANAEPALVSGTNYATITGDGTGPMEKTITFRSNWTQDDSKIMLSGADRFYVIDADTLTVDNGDEGDNTIAGQNHDALPTSDGKYALLTLRTTPYVGDNAANMDGEIQLYDVENGEPVGNPVSVCNSCHGATDERNAVLCGLDGELELVPGTAPAYGAATPDTYEGTVYIAGHGAHFAKVDLVIDPSNTTDPITTATLSRVQVAPAGAPATDYWLHDARIDDDTLYWATYKADQYGYLHYGSLDMTSGTVISDNSIAPDCRSTAGTSTSFYCASGQTDTHYMTITMTNEGYITVIPKDTVLGNNLLTDAPETCPPPNVFLNDIVGDLDYFFIHGSTSPDNSKFLVTFNDNVNTGTSNLYMLDADSVVAGSPVLDTTVTTNTATVTGDGSGPFDATITFRSNWTQDGSKIMLSGADRFYVIDADTLAVENGAEGDNTIAGQNHDALPTTDGAYALLTLRTKPYEGDNAGNMDGEIQLYDVEDGAPIGNSVSVCNSCHGATDERNAILCGLDGEIVAVGDGTYSGTVYIAGHGAHFAKVDLEIDPANLTDPIVATLGRVNVSTPGDTDYLLHDARIDGTDMFWSTYKLDANGMLHYGKVDLTTGTVTADLTVAPDARVLDPTNASSYYCASGQTATHFMPITMTKEGYITVIPKDTIVAP
ncbi:MAG: hypothetical protein LC633_07130 [Desulfobulbaceae bacterium]|nr:hypothetical protein [Desulfobulbaceae bacterium]